MSLLLYAEIGFIYCLGIIRGLEKLDKKLEKIF